MKWDRARALTHDQKSVRVVSTTRGREEGAGESKTNLVEAGVGGKGVEQWRSSWKGRDNYKPLSVSLPTVLTDQGPGRPLPSGYQGVLSPTTTASPLWGEYAVFGILFENTDFIPVVNL